MLNFVSSGKKGDLIMSLYVVKALGGGNLFIRPGEFEESLENVMDSCGALIESQNYVHRFRIYEGEPIDVDLDIFRKSLLLHRTSLLEVICRTHGVEPPSADNFSPWIDVPADQRHQSKVVIHRRSVIKQRRPNQYFDWDKLIDYLGRENVVFVSRLESEWVDFGRRDIAYYCPNDNYEHACIIKGCRLFIGNQSFPSALADALGVDRILELANTLDRKHFTVHYAKNAWYYATNWNNTIKQFRFVEDGATGQYRDLVTGRLVASIPTEWNGWVRQLGTEVKYQFLYRRRLLERHIGYYLRVLK